MSEDTHIDAARKEIDRCDRYGYGVAVLARDGLVALVDEINRLRAELDRCERRHLGRATGDV